VANGIGDLSKYIICPPFVFSGRIVNFPSDKISFIFFVCGRFQMIRQLRVKTNARTELVDITQGVQHLVAESGTRSGVCFIYVPHTTAAVTINENSDPNVGRDLLKELNKVIPFDDNYGHNEGNSAAHIKSSMIGVSRMVLVEEGRLALGTWQALFFCEFDGPRDRRVMVKVVKD
jgi:secondary thiamine-phosphate synthase enzyme